MAGEETLGDVDQLEAEVTRASLKDADTGTRVHDAIERHIKALIDGQPWPASIVAPPDLATHAAGFAAFEKRMNARWVGSEVMFVNEHDGYGGTADALGYFKDAPDNLTLIDFKTGRYSWLEHLLQLAGYWHALAGRYEIKRAAIVQVREAGTWWKPLTITADDIAAFLRCVENYRWLQSRKGIEL